MEHKRNTQTFLSRRWRIISLVLMVVLAAGLASPIVGAAPDHQADQVLRIGYLGMAGSDTANGAQLAINQINAMGGIRVPDGTVYQVELVTLATVPALNTLPESIGQLVDQDVIALLGPDTNALITQESIQALVNTGRPVLTAATGDALTEIDKQDYIFRIRAPERVFGYALANYLVTDLGITEVAAVQTEVEYTEAHMNFEGALIKAGGRLVERVQLPNGDDLELWAANVVRANPQAVVMWGTYADATTMLRLLRNNDWTGVFAYRKANEAARAGVLPADLGEGVIGMDSWSYAADTDLSRTFLRDYVVAYGVVPGPLAAAAYDAIWFLRAAIVNQGIDPAAIQAGLLNGASQNLVQGTLRPIDFMNGDLVRTGVLYALGPYGGSTVLASFDDIQRIGADSGGGPVPAATAIPEPINTPLPTATLEGNWAQVTVNTLNVREGPSFDYNTIGQVGLDEQFRILSTVSDYSWLVIDYQGGVGWIKAEFVTILGDINTIAIMQMPPTPTPAATLTPSVPPNPDIVIDTVTLNPPQPVPGQLFTATVSVRNMGGGAAGRFAVAATWEPGAVYTSVHVEGLAAGQTTQVQLSGTLTGTGVAQVTVVADLNNEIPELNEENNEYNITYRADYPLVTQQASVQLAVNGQWDLHGGTPDFSWDGYNITMLNGAQIAQLQGMTYDNVHYDMLAPASLSYNTTGFGVDKVLASVTFAMITAEGHRAAVRIDNLQAGGDLWFTYRVYANAP